MDALIFQTAQDLAAAIRQRRVSAVEVLEAHLAHSARHNPALNAIVTSNAEEARHRADAADAALAEGVLWGPLHGVPFTAKDAFETAGLRTTAGFPRFPPISRPRMPRLSRGCGTPARCCWGRPTCRPWLSIANRRILSLDAPTTPGT